MIFGAACSALAPVAKTCLQTLRARRWLRGAGSRSASRTLLAIVWRLRVGIEEPGLVGQHDRLDAITEVEFLKYVGDVCLDGRVADVELSADLGVREAACDQAKDIELALSQFVELFWRRELWNARELFDHAFRHDRGEERISAGNDADCGE